MDAKFQRNSARYYEDKARYYKVIVGLLLLTTVTFIQPYMFLTDYTFGTQMLIATIKMSLIVMYYMHLKGEKLIGITVLFAVALVAIFFAIVVTDVKHFQFADVSHITSQELDVSHTTSHEH